MTIQLRSPESSRRSAANAVRRRSAISVAEAPIPVSLAGMAGASSSRMMRKSSAMPALMACGFRDWS